ncbi:hypothetical protein BZA77DRAFT_309854 [Pyronema omphalodes]|nr:hypothetical protein BZA77DRAFT_309854 [Pyronema omphalodes]
MSPSNRGTCNQFSKEGKCRFGNKCKFTHISGGNSSKKPGPTPGRNHAENDRPRVTYAPRKRDWSYQLNDTDAFTPAKFSSIVKAGLEIVDEGESDTKQLLVKSLGEEKGLLWVARALEMEYYAGTFDYGQLLFHDHCIPFLRLISHEEIMSSLILEKAVGTIYNVVYGVSGRRGQTFFTKAVTNLQTSRQYATESLKCEEAIYAISAAFLATINLNHEASIQQGYKTIATSLSQCLAAFPKDRQASYAIRCAERNIQRIKEQLQMGDAIPRMTHPTGATSFIATEFKVDPPGDLSMKGPRHDNDKASIEQIEILPTTSEIKADRSEYLPLKYREFPHHENGILRLLDTQFRLLREDTAGQLRDAVCALVAGWEVLVKSKDRNARRKHLRRIDAKLCIFDNIKVSKLRFDRKKGMMIDITFNQPDRVAKTERRKREEWWKESKYLQVGNLVALVDENMETTFLLVADRQLFARPKDGESIEQFRMKGIQDLTSDENRAMISLVLVTPKSELDQARIIDLVQQKSKGGAIMVEFPGLVYASFEPVLKCLQNLHRNPTLPFTKYLTMAAPEDYKIEEGFVKIQPPLYLSKIPGTQLDLSCITNHNYPLTFSLNHPTTIQQLQTHTTLDHGQCESLLMSLKHELALVQGPPGTGKSFVGHKIVQILLHNRNKLKIGPIICVCYTNHALDQFLMHLLNSGYKNIIRMGSRSKCEALQDFTLHSVRRGSSQTRVEKHNIWSAQRELDEVDEELSKLLKQATYGCRDGDIAYHLLYNDLPTYQLLYEGARDYGFGKRNGNIDKDKDGWMVVGNKTCADIFRIWSNGGTYLQKNSWKPVQGQQPRPIQTLLRDRVNPWMTTHRERQSLRSYWEEIINSKLQQKIESLMAKFTDAEAELRAQYKEADKRCLEEAHIIGVTTTGLASNSELLRSLSAKVLVCEEAAEVLEAHLITALLPSVEHAILIGDHLQLRATISRYELSMESDQGKKYGLDESLFERLANERFNGAKMPIAALDTQRRMHPSIASLVRETLYPQLKDYENTQKYPEVVGMRRRLFWLDHEHREDSGENDEPTQTSKSNEFEAEIVVSLVRHLARQGVYTGKDDIAVLTPYLGQLRKLRKKLADSFDLVIGDRDMEQIEAEEEDDIPMPTIVQQKPRVTKGRLLDGVRIATVDNFQGEEAKVIIVSLVRSNEAHKCGFLKTSNRINVLLSRAQHGMYIIGDSQTSKGIPMWNQVINMLQARDNIGPFLELQCPRHPDTPIPVSTAHDFNVHAPEGGCSEQCGKRLTCGHTCILKCHSNTLHSLVQCKEDCMRSYTHCDHPCPKRCWETCGNCKVRLVSKHTLPCGHTPATLQCWETIDLANVKCMEKVQKIVPGCNHVATVNCCVDIEKHTCQNLCGALLPCGHKCARRCSDCRKKPKPEKGKETEPETENQPTTEVIIDHGTCIIPCGRSYTTCNHACSAPCHPGKDCPNCNRPCEVKCTHSHCPNKCSEPCTPCAEPCNWHCKHQSEPCHMPCAVPCDIIPCSVRCDKQLNCGHQCPSICGESCPASKFCQLCAKDEILDTVLDLIMFTTYRDMQLDLEPVVFLACGHFFSVTTLDGIMDIKTAYEVDEEGRILAPKNFNRADMKGCPTCRAPLRNIHRYNRVVKSALLDEATKRFMAHAGKLQTETQKLVEESEANLEDTINQFKVRCQATNTAFSKTEQIKSYQKKAKGFIHQVSTFVNTVQQQEQPYGKVHEMVLNARRRRGAKSQFELDNAVIQHGFRFRGQAMLLRITWAIVWNYKTFSAYIDAVDFRNKWKSFVVPLLVAAKQDCMKLLQDSHKAGYNKQIVESLVYHAQFTALELLHAPPGQDNQPSEEQRKALVAHEFRNLDNCLDILKVHPQCEYLRDDIQKAKTLLNGGTFYSFVTNEEKKAIYDAMANEFRGTGHWYYCQNGHPFSVGECGMPMQLARCPECTAPVGGRDHVATAGVQRAADFEHQFARMGI